MKPHFIRVWTVGVMIVFGFWVLAASGGESDGEGTTDTGDKPYTVKCESQTDCKVDQDTYVGWRTYHSWCAQCHAQNAVGSTFAPSLVKSLQRIDRETFNDRVLNGFQGQIGVMPAWKDNPNVTKRLDEIYAYLLARADDVLPPGRPERFD